MSVRVFLVDDHPLFRAGVRLAMEDADDLEVVGEASTGEEAVPALRSPDMAADVVLMDLLLPGRSGIETTRALITEAPPGTTAPRVLIVSMSDEDDAVVAAIRAGAHGYLVKGTPREELLRAVRTVAEGGAVFSSAVAARLSGYFSAVHDLPGRAAFPQLTERERQILDLLARGYTNRRIARELVLSEKTVRNHVSHVFTKLQVTDRTEATVRARDAGLGV
ncbi:response regulator [Wenjunlia tyrosinilytica]|uniref:DNA-binding response regulator n=1 Tax=Wenjunlia tyrosinilytica TaxID=1544741 RepID=A0A917ZN25_9ACTN|nr:response regulator transcription factor [Wenjunlia tyrosinilytica]GGO87584.1 DNA-binding response regulator [Wenjunlia tyrosinilytica]